MEGEGMRLCAALIPRDPGVEVDDVVPEASIWRMGPVMAVQVEKSCASIYRALHSTMLACVLRNQARLVDFERLRVCVCVCEGCEHSTVTRTRTRVLRSSFRQHHRHLHSTQHPLRLEQ